MVDEVLPRAPLLPLVRARCEAKGADDQVAIKARRIRLDVCKQFVHEILMTLRYLDNGHWESVLSPPELTSRARGAAPETARPGKARPTLFRKGKLVSPFELPRLRGSSQGGLFQKSPKRLRFEQVPLSALAGLELVEHARDLARRLLPLALEAGDEGAVRVGRVEHPLDDELRRNGPVPVVLLQAEDDVVAARSPEAVELPAHAEGDRTAAILAVLGADAEAQMLSVADRREVDHFARRREQRHVRVPEPEGGHAGKLLEKLYV